MLNGTLGPFQKGHEQTNHHAGLWVVAVILLIALIVRVVWTVAAPQVDPIISANPYHGDALDYDAIARNVIAGRGFTIDDVHPTAYRAPVYPLLLSLFYAVSDHSLLFVRLIQAGLGVGVVYLTWLLGRDLFTQAVGALAALIVAIHPLLIYFGVYLWTETLYTILITAVAYGLLRGLQAGRLRWIALAGMLFGLAALTRPQALVQAPLMLLVVLIYFRQRGPARRLLAALILALTTLAPIAPWTVRNLAAFHELILIDTHGGYTLYGSYDPAAGGAFVDRPLPGGQDWNALSETERDEVYYGAAIAWIEQNPGAALSLIPARLWRASSPTTIVVGELNGWWTPYAHAIYLLFQGLAAAGLVIGFRRNRLSVVLWLAILNTLLVTALFYGTMRLSLPMLPSLAVFFGLFSVWLARKHPASRRFVTAVNRAGAP